MPKNKLNIKQLPGDDKERVFIGGQYDFVPTLRAIAHFVQQISTPERTYYPIIPLDYDIPVTETMDRDLQILGQCKFAIFDLSDLGAQLVEMQEARQKINTITSLLVYPVRERVNEPERGRRTVLSFGLPHFGYSTFRELEGIVWRFLMDAATEKDYSPRNIYDPDLDREIKRSRAFLSHNRHDDARDVLKKVLDKSEYQNRIEPWLQLALVECREQNMGKCNEALERAQRLAGQEHRNQAEVLYYRAVVELLMSNLTGEAIEKIVGLLSEADRLKPGDARYLQPLGYALWKKGDVDSAITQTRDALDDPNIPDPVVAVGAMNNLAYYLCEQMTKGNGTQRNLDEAVELTKHLQSYHKAFRRHEPSWLDTRGWILSLKAEALRDGRRPEEARETIDTAIEVLEQASKMQPNAYIEGHLKNAREIRKGLYNH